MEVKSFQNVADQIGPFAVLVYSVECITRSLCRQRWNFWSLASGWDSGDTRRYAETNVAEMAQLLCCSIDLLGVCSMWVENDSALSRIMSISVEEMDGRGEAKSSGFAIPAPMTLESRRRK